MTSLIAIRLGCVAMLTTLVMSCSSKGAAAAHAHPSPTTDAITRNYVALVHRYWMQEQSADEALNGSNVAAKVCLGVDPPGAPTNLQLVDPVTCRERAAAVLANVVWFLTELDRTPAPPRFALDDQAFRVQLSKATVDLGALIAATDSGDKNAVLQAATAYNNDMYPVVTDALNDVDPSVHHP